MHVSVQQMEHLADGTLAITVAGAAEWLRGARAAEIELRFAAASSGGAHLVIGLRLNGSGLDVLVPAVACSALLPDPAQLLICASEEADLRVSATWDEDRFSTFLDHVEAMQVELPDHPVWGALAKAFMD